jgi:hypothetical protein
MSKKKQANYEKYNEVAPRCLECRYYERRISLDETKFLHFCRAKFNGNDLIFKETLDICSQDELFREK